MIKQVLNSVIAKYRDLSRYFAQAHIVFEYFALI